MKKIVSIGSRRYEVTDRVEPGSTTLGFPTQHQAAAFLRELVNDYFNAAALQPLVDALFVAHTPRPVHDPDVQRELAHRLVSGALHVVPLPAAEASVLALEVQEDEPKKAQPTPFKKKKTWIEILLVDEQEQPVADRRYRITLPDGVTVKEGRTDARGHARLEEIDPGTCKVSFPDMDRGVWRRA